MTTVPQAGILQQIIEQYCRHPQVTAIRYERNTPITTILNYGIRIAHGRYFSLRYADDYYLPYKLKRQVAVFEELPTEYGVVDSTGYRLIGAPPPPAGGPETPVEADPDATGLTM